MKFYLFISMSMTLVLETINYSTTLPKSNSGTPYLGDKNLPIPDSVPIYVMRNHCPENMQLYPRNGENITWACDCMANFLYFPLTDSCHEVYRQGPCPQGQYVNLVMGEEVPRCTENPCSVDGLVPYNGSCYALGVPNGPCGPYSYLSVNEATYEVYCNNTFESRTYKLLFQTNVDLPFEMFHIAQVPITVIKQPESAYKTLPVTKSSMAMPFVADVPDIVTKKSGPPCPKGKKRAINGACRTVWLDNLQPASSS